MVAGPTSVAAESKDVGLSSAWNCARAAAAIRCFTFFPSPRRGEGGERSEPGEGLSEIQIWLREPLTPTLSPTGRGSARAVLTSHATASELIGGCAAFSP